MNLLAQLSAIKHAPTTRRGHLTPEQRAKQAATLRRKAAARWKLVFDALGGQAGTTAIANHSHMGNMSAYNALRRLENHGTIKRVGTIPHPINGRDQIIWAWVGEGA